MAQTVLVSSGHWRSEKSGQDFGNVDGWTDRERPAPLCQPDHHIWPRWDTTPPLPPQLNLRQGSTRTCLQRLQQKWQSFGGWLLLSFYLDFIPKVQHLWMVSNMWETAFVSSWSPVTFSSLAPQSNIYLCWVTAPAHRKLMDGAKKTIWWDGIWWAENKLFSVVCIYVCCPHLEATC